MSRVSWRRMTLDELAESCGSSGSPALGRSASSRNRSGVHSLRSWESQLRSLGAERPGTPSRGAAKAILGLIDEFSAGGYSQFRVIPSIGPVKRTIAVNASVETESQVLPYEILEDHIARVEPQVFAAIPCPCRTAAELAGNPCERASENYCTVAGPVAQHIVKEGLGRELTREGLLALMKRAEADGLVHQTTNIQDRTMFICNCCPCCCPYLISRKRFLDDGASARSDFLPVIDHELCTLCEDCADVCPMEAVYHHWPHQPDGSDDFIRVRTELCIGCGDCASVPLAVTASICSGDRRQRRDNS